jgi:hypothetical protein
MNEVTVLAKAGEGAGRAVGTGLRAARRGTVVMSRHGAAAVLAATRAGTSARASAAQRAAALRTANLSVPAVSVPTVSLPELKTSLPDLLAQRHLTGLRQDLAKRIEPKARRRRWPYVLVGLLALGAAAAVVARRPVAPPPAPFAPTTVPSSTNTTEDTDATEDTEDTEESGTSGPS